MNFTGKIIEIKKLVRSDQLRYALFLGIFIAIYSAVGYFFELDINLMMIIGIPIIFLGMILADIASKIYGTSLLTAMIIETWAEEIVSAKKKENISKREEHIDEYDDEEYEEE